MEEIHKYYIKYKLYGENEVEKLENEKNEILENVSTLSKTIKNVRTPTLSLIYRIIKTWESSVLEFGGGELNKIWEQNAFIDFPSQFQVWKQGLFNGEKVQVKGQLRYEYEAWFHDDFFVIIDWQEFILRQDDGSTKKYKLVQELDKDIDMSSYKSWQNSVFWSKDIFIQETGILKLSSVKGYINMQILPGKSYQYVDGIIDGHMVYIEKQTDSWNIRILLEQK